MTSPDVDRGWAFVVLLGSCLLTILSLGFPYAPSVFYSTFLDEFEQSPSLTAWAVNLNTFTSSIAGEFCVIVFGLMGHRMAVVTGCLISTIGLLACSFATSLVWILVMYGIVTGVGFAILYFSTFEMISIYFTKYRVLAFTITATGVSLGQFIYAPLLQVLIDEFHWRGTFIVVAGINLNALLVAAAYISPRILEPVSGCDLKKEPIRRKIKEQLHERFRSLRLFLQPRWTLFCIGIVCTQIGNSGFLTHISRFGETLGYSKADAAFIASAFGISGVCTRPVMGLIAQHPNIHVIGFYTILTFLFGTCVVISGFMSNFTILLICSALNGLFASCQCFFGEAIIQIVGVKKVNSGASYACIFAAVGNILGGPIGAWGYEADPTYTLSFIIVGVITMSGMVMYLPSWLVCSHGKLKQRESVDEASEK